jgi:hypothetical protein
VFRVRRDATISPLRSAKTEKRLNETSICLGDITVNGTNPYVPTMLRDAEADALKQLRRAAPAKYFEAARAN